MQLHKELKEDEPKDIEVKWIDPGKEDPGDAKYSIAHSLRSKSFTIRQRGSRDFQDLLVPAKIRLCVRKRSGCRT